MPLWFHTSCELGIPGCGCWPAGDHDGHAMRVSAERFEELTTQVIEGLPACSLPLRAMLLGVRTRRPRGRLKTGNSPVDGGDFRRCDLAVPEVGAHFVLEVGDLVCHVLGMPVPEVRLQVGKGVLDLVGHVRGDPARRQTLCNRGLHRRDCS